MGGTGDDKPRESWSYSGEVWTDDNGRAVVVLPPFVRAHRHGFDYELTPLESSRSATVLEKIADNRFTIATEEPLVKVAWRVTALRPAQPPKSDSGSRRHQLGEEESRK
jgi:cytosine/adenosine deaminase-related metal-dependent hydrolase